MRTTHNSPVKQNSKIFVFNNCKNYILIIFIRIDGSLEWNTPVPPSQETKYLIIKVMGRGEGKVGYRSLILENISIGLLAIKEWGGRRSQEETFPTFLLLLTRRPGRLSLRSHSYKLDTAWTVVDIVDIVDTTLKPFNVIKLNPDNPENLYCLSEGHDKVSVFLVRTGGFFYNSCWNCRACTVLWSTDDYLCQCYK